MAEGLKKNAVEPDIDALGLILQEETRLLDALIHLLSEGTAPNSCDPDVARVSVLMIQSLGVSLHSILRLTGTKDMAIRDAYGIARSASELAVNICYIGAAGEEMARRAERHAMQKSYRDLHRTGAIGGVAFELSAAGRPEVDQVPGLADALKEFTGRKGQEITDWTPLNISSRIETVAQIHSRASLALSGSTMAVYRHASELLHGTYFSIVHFWAGSGAPATSREDFNSRWVEHFISIFTGAFFAAQAVIELFAKLVGVPELADAQKRLTAKVHKHVAQISTRISSEER
jgi:hypothetical protein